MDVINDGIRFINSSIDACTDYIKGNAIQLVIIAGLIYYLKNSVGKKSQGYTLNQSRPAATSSSDTDASSCCDACLESSTNTTTLQPRDSSLMAVRERQQELANQRAQEATKLRKEKQDQERDRKNQVAKKKPPKGGDVLGGGGSCEYNPMQPSTGNSSGYRPARRTARKGGWS